ncbi:hypothetical protein QYE76_004018 [Lolium multiflorum]|uniref:DUF4283 domain-containing protein n=1 Tax=Lolium multiflorum TaxID=4521 RepID=A0AAD8W1U0_LOLMU|nr:hypothetical protein QYE76_004018 [Lolium multiflorum]
MSGCSGGVSSAPLSRHQAMLGLKMLPEEDGNWDDGQGMKEDLGFRQGAEAEIGGIVDMEDYVYLEFDDEEEEEVKKAPADPHTWKLLARYMANFKPNTRAMFTRFVDEVWRLRNGIKYSERGKNYYMITLFSKGDYDFVMRGGPWIFDQHALIVKNLNETAQPSETILNSVPVWVRIYDVPWGKQNKTWGMRYANGLGKALEVDEPSEEQDENEFLRVRVNLPYDRRLQTQITTGVKGKPREVKVFKLKYERVPYYCSHCGFMGHRKDECEKKRLGIPSLDYDAHKLRCSPYKKIEHRAHFVPPLGQASTRRNLSFASFGSAESRKSSRPSRVQNQGYAARRHSTTPEVGSRQGSENDDMPPLMDDIVADAYELEQDGFEGEEKATGHDIELNLAAKVDAMQVESSAGGGRGGSIGGRDASQLIIQFPDDEASPNALANTAQVHISMTPDMLARMQRLQSTAASTSSGGKGPSSNDMIPALRNLSTLQVSFGSASDVSMLPADSVLGKRGADEGEVQGERLELSLGLNYGVPANGGAQKEGNMQGRTQEQAAKKNVNMFYKRSKKLAATGHVPSGNLTRPNVWSRQEQ